MTTFVGVVCAAALGVVSLLALYQWALAAVALLPVRRRRLSRAVRRSRFLVLIPAHDEEAGLAATLRSLQQAAYPASLIRPIVIADRCADGTAAVARSHNVECLERTSGPGGKGAAIAWAVAELQRERAEFDGLVIMDGDTLMDPQCLHAFDESLRAGHDVQQGYNYLSNPWASPFTRIIAVTGVLRNGLFYAGKERIGLSSMLSGTGMCFSRRIIGRYQWTAFSVGEDWEFSVALLLNGERIHFNERARVLPLESHGFRQASRQRLRWASGRQGVASGCVLELIAAGVKQRRFELWDAAMTMVAPTYSVQATVALVCLGAAWLIAADPSWRFLLTWAMLLTLALAAYFAMGIARTQSPARALLGIVLIPAFLPWRTAIELLGMMGYGRKRWGRTARVSASKAVPAILAAAMLLPAGVEAQVIFQDDFERSVLNSDGTISLWDGPHDSSVMYPRTGVANSGRQSLELKYVPGSKGSSFMYQPFVGQERVYVRWYQRWSEGFIWEPSSTKLVILRPRGGYPQFYPEVLWGNGQLAIQAQVIAEANWDSRNFYQNVGAPIVFEPGRWYCIEVLVQLNTPGTADGELAAWIDGEKKLSYTGREFRGAHLTDPAPASAKIEAVGLSGYYGGLTTVPQSQYSWQDDVVISLAPVGRRLFAEDFEATVTNADGTLAGWDGPSLPSAMYVGDRVAHSLARALELSYAAGARTAGSLFNYFPPQQQVYLRWYQRWSAGFVWEPSTTGLLGLRPSYSYPHFYAFVAGSTRRFAVQGQVLADRNWSTENLVQNLGEPVAFEPDRWYCVEMMVKLNTPGLSDGTVAAWIDGEQKLSYTNRQFVGTNPDDLSPSGARLNALVITGQYGGQLSVPQLQFSWQDDFFASTERVGCAVSPTGDR